MKNHEIDGKNVAGAGPEDYAPDPRNVRLLKRAIYIMTALILVGTIVLVTAIVRRTSNLSGSHAGFGTLNIEAMEGGEVNSFAIDGDRMALRVKTARGVEIVIIDIRQGREQGRVLLEGAR